MDSKTQEFLQKIKDKGCWNDNLDYSKGVYKGSREPFEVWCKIHKIEVTKKSSRELFSINWYDYKEVLFAVVRFKSYGKEYVYGGWEYKFDSYWDLKKAFDGADSHGSFFLENIKPATINCSS